MSAELRRLLAAATPLRWYHLIDDYGEGDRAGSMFLTHEAVLNNRQTPLATGLSMADAELICAAVNALPALLDEVERLHFHTEYGYFGYMATAAYRAWPGEGWPDCHICELLGRPLHVHQRSLGCMSE